jgi:hypothetical protein
MVVTPLYDHSRDAWDTGYRAEVTFKFVSTFHGSFCYVSSFYMKRVSNMRNHNLYVD